MKIKNRDNTEVEFRNLKAGDVFESEDSFYIKTNTYESVNLVTGGHVCVPDAFMVKPVDGEFTVR